MRTEDCHDLQVSQRETESHFGTVICPESQQVWSRAQSPLIRWKCVKRFCLGRRSIASLPEWNQISETSFKTNLPIDSRTEKSQNHLLVTEVWTRSAEKAGQPRPDESPSDPQNCQFNNCAVLLSHLVLVFLLFTTIDNWHNFPFYYWTNQCMKVSHLWQQQLDWIHTLLISGTWQNLGKIGNIQNQNTGNGLTLPHNNWTKLW